MGGRTGCGGKKLAHSRGGGWHLCSPGLWQQRLLGTHTGVVAFENLCQDPKPLLLWGQRWGRQHCPLGRRVGKAEARTLGTSWGFSVELGTGMRKARPVLGCGVGTLALGRRHEPRRGVQAGWSVHRDAEERPELSAAACGSVWTLI